MFQGLRIVAVLTVFATCFLAKQEGHNHSAPEKLGTVSFPISCASSVQSQFDRGIAFAPQCAFARGPAGTTLRISGTRTVAIANATMMALKASA